MRRTIQALKNPQVQLAIAALTIGIGATTAIYTVVHAVLLEPLPWSDSSRWFYIFGSYRGGKPNSGVSFAYKDSQSMQARLQSIDAFGCYDVARLFGGNYNAAFNGQTLHLAGLSADSKLIRSLGVQPSLGRWFEEERTAVLSDSLWRKFGADPQILGKTIDMNGASYRIVGVAPPSFRLPVDEPRNEIWTPLVGDRGPGESNYLNCLAKLKPGTSQRQMEDEMKAFQAQWAREHKDDPDGVIVVPVLDFVNQAIRPTLLLLLGASAALLLIACANVASLLLARAVGRARDTAIRVALGATPWQLAAKYFGEGLIVALPAAALGTLASLWAVRQVLALAADDIPRAERVSLNWPVLGFTLAVAIGCAVFFSLAPLWQARRTSPNEALSDGSRASASARSHRLLRIFVVAEMALAFGLAAIGGLLLNQLSSLRRVQPGFDPNHVLTLAMNTPTEKYREEQQRIDYDARLVGAIRAIPGVESAGFGWRMPLLGGASTTMWLDGQPEPEYSKAPPVTQDFVSPDYFHAMGIPLLEGRFYTDTDRGDSSSKPGTILPLIINQAAARFYWAGRDPLGSLVHMHSFPGPRFQIVGVVGDIRNLSLDKPIRPEVYFTFREVPLEQMAWAIRSPLAQAPLLREIRQAVATVDPEQAIFDVRPLAEIVSNSMVRQRLASFMVAFFAISALILAILGVYGVVAYSVRQRTTEMGTRMALGAISSDLLRLVIGDGLKMSGIGIGIGLISVLGLARWLSSTDLHLQFASPWPFLAACAITALASGLACFVPGWRTAQLSPLVAIRNDARSSGAEAPRRLKPTPQGDLDLSGLVDSSRDAESFSEAIQSALAKLRAEVNAEFAALLIHSAPGEPYRTVGASGTNLSSSYPANNLLMPRLRHYSTALPMTPDDLESALRATGRTEEIQTLQQMEARLAAPVSSKSEEFGLLLLGAPRGRNEYSSSERRAVYRAGSHFALLVTNGRLAQRVVEQERLRHEMQVAAEVQKRLFPEKLPETAVIHCAGLCIPARGVGGDYYDFLDLGYGKIGIALADVAGKGIAAALVMSVVQASLRSLAETDGAALADLAAKMNRLLYRSTGTSSYATFFYARFDEERRELRYVNAGHNPPYLLRNSGEMEELPAGGLVIGMFPAARYEEAALQLRPGDVLIVFSDGVPEAHNPEDEEFGEDRLKDLLRKTACLSVNEMATRILDELKDWMRDAPQFDDLTFILMKVR